MYTLLLNQIGLEIRNKIQFRKKLVLFASKSKNQGLKKGVMKFFMLALVYLSLSVLSHGLYWLNCWTVYFWKKNFAIFKLLTQTSVNYFCNYVLFCEQKMADKQKIGTLFCKKKFGDCRQMRGKIQICYSTQYITMVPLQKYFALSLSIFLLL